MTIMHVDAYIQCIMYRICVFICRSGAAPSSSVMCRICQITEEEDDSQPFIRPCRCKYTYYRVLLPHCAVCLYNYTIDIRLLRLLYSVNVVLSFCHQAAGLLCMCICRVCRDGARHHLPHSISARYYSLGIFII